MINGAVKLAIGIGVAVAAWYTDKYVKKKTGKHIHQHVIGFVEKLWARWKAWAAKYLAEHPRVQTVFLDAVDIAATIKRAKDKGAQSFKFHIFGVQKNATQGKVIAEEDVPLDQAGQTLARAKKEPILAMRY